MQLLVIWELLAGQIFCSAKLSTKAVILPRGLVRAIQRLYHSHSCSVAPQASGSAQQLEQDKDVTTKTLQDLPVKKSTDALARHEGNVGFGGRVIITISYADDILVVETIKVMVFYRNIGTP